MTRETSEGGERFTAVVEALAGRPGVISPEVEAAGRRRFGSNGLKVYDRVFAMLVQDLMVVKLPAKRVETLVAAGEGERFALGSRVMKEWLSVAPRPDSDWFALAEEALAFVSGEP